MMCKDLVKNFKVGSDPELFLFSEKKNKFVPVCGLVGGTKDKPIPINQENDGFSLQEDNVALEYTIPPASSLKEWLGNMNFVKNYVKDVVLKPLDLVPAYVASARFHEEDLNSEAAQHMGCSSSFNAWTFEQHQVDRSDYTLRTSGLHVHIGYDNPEAEINIELIRAMDLFLGVPSVLIDPDTERRKMYGKAGDYRFKAYGVEYRCLSGYFGRDDEHLAWVYNNTLAAIEFFNSGGIITNPDDIIKCINDCDKGLANEIIEDYKIGVMNYDKVKV